MSDREQDRREEREDLVPGPDEPAAPGEEAHAESFGRLLGGLLAGEPLPPAMESEERALLETATVVVASTRGVELSPERRDAVIDQALERGASREKRRPTPVPAEAGEEAPREAAPEGEAIPLSSRRRGRVLRALPWAVASAAAAAAIFLYATRGGPQAPEGLSDVHRSRPSGGLIGQIRAEDAARAGERLDTIYADRIAGYRDLYFRRKLGGSR